MRNNQPEPLNNVDLNCGKWLDGTVSFFLGGIEPELAMGSWQKSYPQDWVHGRKTSSACFWFEVEWQARLGYRASNWHSFCEWP
jgi:hypothetical protein